MAKAKTLKSFLIRGKIELNGKLDTLFKKSKTAKQVRTGLVRMGYREHDLQKAKKMSHLGDFLTVEYDGRLVPFQVVDICEGGNRVLHSWYILEEFHWDASKPYDKSNVRKYLNGDFLKKFNPAFAAGLKDVDVPFRDKILHDKVFLPCHEELGLDNSGGYWKANKGAKCWGFFKKHPYADHGGGQANII